MSIHSCSQLSSILIVNVSEPVSIVILVGVVGYFGSLNEEVGCQARGILKRQVVRPMRNSLGERIVGN
jgi:hypothetical protein